MLRHTIVFALVVLLVAGVVVAGETAWLDWEKCGMCSNMASNPALMENMAWEQHNISNGVVSICTVDAKYLDDYRTAGMKMAEVSKGLQQGKMVEMCGSCTALGMCMMKGATPEYVQTSTGSVMIITSDNPEVVAELQAWAKRNKEEMAKIEG